MKSLPEVINKALPGYYPENCSADTFAKLTHERRAMAEMLARITIGIHRTLESEHPDAMKLQAEIETHGHHKVLAHLIEEYLKQDMEGFLAREMGLNVIPHFVGDVYAEYCDWKESNATIDHLDFEPAS